MIKEDEVSKIIVDSVIEVHRALGGSGLLESAYKVHAINRIKTRGD